MRQSSKSALVLLLVGIGASGVTTLIVGTASKWSIIALSSVVFVTFSIAAYLRGWHKAPHRIGTPIRAAIIFGFIGAMVAVLAAVVWPRVIIRPAKVEFGSGIENENFIFTITNNTEEEAFSVESMFRVETTDQFSLDLPVSSRKPIVDGSEVADTKAIACEDQQHRPLLLVWIYRIKPKESRELTFTHGRNATQTMNAAITYYTSTPLPRINDPLKSTETYHFPGETITCDSTMMFWLDPTKPPARIDASFQLRHGGH